MNRNYDYFVTRNVTPPWIAGQKLLKPWLGGGIASLIALSLNWGPSKQGGPEVEDPKTIKYHRVTQHETCIWTTVCREPPELKPTHTRSIVEISMATCLEVPAPASSWDMAIYKISNAINFGSRCSIGGDSLQKKIWNNTKNILWWCEPLLYLRADRCKHENVTAHGSG